MEIVSAYSTDIKAFAIFNAMILLFLALDLGIFHKRPKVISYKESILWSLVWVSTALLFCGWLYIDQSPDIAMLFLTGYSIEKTLSMDNVMVFALIFTSLNIPLKYQHRVLFWGIVGALIMRTIMIFIGYKLISEFSFMIYIFGGFLVLTGLKILIEKDKPQDVTKMFIWKLTKRFVPMSEKLDKQKFFTIENGKRVGTPLLMALLLVEFTDVIFAIDSIPAIFAVTKDPFIVYTSNVFAILGLRALYFMLAGAMRDFHYLKPALAIVLIFVGLKMVQLYKLPADQSLLVVLALLGGGVIASLLLKKKI